VKAVLSKREKKKKKQERGPFTFFSRKQENRPQHRAKADQVESKRRNIHILVSCNRFCWMTKHFVSFASFKNPFIEEGSRVDSS
jgi:hypothetical protein